MTAIRVSGPLFDGRAEAYLHEGTDRVRTELAREGERLARAAFASSIREDTGRFLGSVTMTDHSTVYTKTSGRKTYSLPVVVDDIDSIAVTTDMATYGPWLEGTGSRNETTRFKGYAGFRRAGDELESRAQSRGEEIIRPYVERSN